MIDFRATPGGRSFLDFVGDGIISADLNGRGLDVGAWTPTGGLPLTELAADNVLTVEAVGLYTNSGEGIHRFVDPEDGEVYLYSQFEAADAKRFYPCFDQPDLKARFTVDVLVPEHWVVIANGAEDAVVEVPADITGGRPTRRHRFATTAPLSTYVTALVAGPYHVVSDEHDGIPLRLLCRRTLAGHLDADVLFAQTKQGFDFYHRAFSTRYPFGKYDQIFVPEFNAGAMENAAAVTVREEYVFRSRVTRYLYERRCETLLHELAHMWFGDLVTMRWWDDLWLNESFATWASVLAQSQATEFAEAWTTFATVEKSWAYVQDQLPSTHPIAADMVDLQAVEVNFDGITYAKGASVLKQLACYVGLEEFLAGLRAYFGAHAFGNATLRDLLDSLERSSGRDLTAWSAAWLETTGLNSIALDVRIGDDGLIQGAQVIQGPAEPGAGELRPHRLAVGIYDDEDGRLVRIQRIELDVTGARTPIPELVGARPGVLRIPNDDDLTYAKVHLDEQSLATAAARVADLVDPLPRTLAWSALWESTRDAVLPARDFVAAVLRGVSAESEIGVAQRLLSQAQLALTSYVDPDWAAEVGWAAFAEHLIDLATAAPPGGDLQLAAVQAVAASQLSADQVELLAQWREESAPLIGLTIDQELSWTLLFALIAHGAAGRADIDAAEAADPTASGSRRATTARALVPRPEAKRDVWEQLVNDDGMSNAVRDANLAGFVHPAQMDLLGPFVQPYFDHLDALWQRRSPEVAQRIVTGLYPRWSIDAQTVALSRAWENGEHLPSLARLVSESRSGVERAVRARRRDRAAARTGN